MTEHYKIEADEIATHMNYAEWTSYCEEQNDKTLLKIAIEKWTLLRDTVAEKKVPIRDGGTYTCPLCRMYFDHDCNGCPIMLDTGRECCENTPYEDYEPWSWMDIEDMTDEVLACGLKYLNAEIEFLTRLLNELEEQ